MVKIYTSNSCPWCIKVKNYLKKNNVKFEELNVNDNPSIRDELISKSGQSSLPVLDINNNIVIGFNKENIDKYIMEVS